MSLTSTGTLSLWLYKIIHFKMEQGFILLILGCCVLDKKDSHVISENVLFVLKGTPLLETCFYLIRSLKGTFKDNGLSNFILTILKPLILFVMHKPYNSSNSILCPRCLYPLFQNLVCLSMQSIRSHTNHTQTLHLLTISPTM